MTYYSTIKHHRHFTKLQASILIWGIAACIWINYVSLPYTEANAAFFSMSVYTLIGVFVALSISETDSERSIFVKIFLYSYIVRMLVCFLFSWYFYSTFGDPFFRHDGIIVDNGDYHIFASNVARFILDGDYLSIFYEMVTPGGNVIPRQYGYGTIIGIQYAIFGSFKIVGVLFNSLIGSIIPLIVYRICKRIFDENIALYAALLNAFFPTMVVYAAYLLKDILAAFCLLMLIYAQTSNKIKSNEIIIIISTLLVILFVRIQLVFIIGFCLVVYSLLQIKYQSKKHIIILCISIFIISGILLYGINNFGIFKGNIIPYLHKQSQLNYSLYLNLSENPNSVIFRISTLPLPLKAIIGALFAQITPFPPWRAWNAGFYQASLVPGNLIWYILLVYITLGIWYSVRKKKIKTFLAILIIVSISIIIGLVSLGNDYRYRIQITPIMLLFSSVGYYKYKKKAFLYKQIYFYSFIGGITLYTLLKYT